jgi:hypothetical protein
MLKPVVRFEALSRSAIWGQASPFVCRLAKSRQASNRPDLALESSSDSPRIGLPRVSVGLLVVLPLPTWKDSNVVKHVRKVRDAVSL